MFNPIKHIYNKITYLKSLQKALKDYQKKLKFHTSKQYYHFPYTGICFYYKTNFPKLVTFLKADLISLGYDPNKYILEHSKPFEKQMLIRIELLQKLIEINKL